MRVHYAKLLIVAAIASAAESKTTTSVAGNPTTPLNSTTNGGDGERRFISTMVEEVSAYFTSQKLKNVAKELEAFHDDHELDSMPNFYKWLDAAKIGAPGSHPQDSEAAIKVLTARFGDYRIARFNQAAKETRETMKYAVDLEEAQMKYWLDRKMSARDVFKLLNSHETEYGFLTDPVFMYYSTYVKRLNTVYPHMKPNSINAIPEHFSSPGSLEKRFNMALEIALGSSTRAMKLSKAERDTTRLNLMQYWLDNETSLRDVSKCWMNFYSKSSIAVKKSRPMASLAACIGEDGLFTLIEAELKVHKSSIFADQMQAERFKYWIMNGKSLMDVFELLKLDRAGLKVLENPLLNTFTKFSEVYSKSARKSVKRGFITPEYAPGTPMSVTTNSEKALFQLWFASKKSPQDVFKLLNLDTAGDELFASSVFPTFLKYLDGHNLNPEVNTVSTFVIIRNYYDLTAIANMILAAKEGSRSWYGAARLQSEIFALWKNIYDLHGAGYQLLGIKESDEAMMRLYNVFSASLPKDKKVYRNPGMFTMVEHNFNALKRLVETWERDKVGEMIGKTAEEALSYKAQLIELLPYLEKDVLHAEQVKVMNDWVANMKTIKKPPKKES